VTNPHITAMLGDIQKYPREIQEEVIKLMQKLITLDFGSTFTKVEVGPVVRTYFFEPKMNAILSKVMSRPEDLALSLGVDSVIISRDKQYISIAVPRKDREVIQFDKCLFSMLTAPEVKSMSLPILMGKTPKGENLFIDLQTQPHLLIGGTTGSGKSIFTSQVICSLALFHSSNELRFTLVDTKQLDLTLFQGLPHIGNVIQDIHALREKLTELLDLVRKRTAIMSGVARNINEWNKQGLGQKFEYQILIIDEFADVVMQDRNYISSLKPSVRPVSIEELTQTLTQIARAAGVHCIIATQRPSVKLINGDLKTNCPARVAFQLPSMQDSRVIIDINGAEKLLGAGDYLYKIQGSSEVKRAHSAFVTLNDIATIITQADMLREQYVKR
jgi:S-DNA-T family DNA segregation ATPase FtsK/SpoIIIE